MQRCASPVPGPQGSGRSTFCRPQWPWGSGRDKSTGWALVLFMCTHQNLWCVHAKIEACVSTMEIPTYQLARPPFVVSIGVKAKFWFFFFCLPKKSGIGRTGLNAFFHVQTLQYASDQKPEAAQDWGEGSWRISIKKTSVQDKCTQKCVCSCTWKQTAPMRTWLSRGGCMSCYGRADKSE